jgi:hypothetical protein
MKDGTFHRVQLALEVGPSAQRVDSQIAVNVPFLLYSSGTRMNSSTVGRPVSVVGYVSFSSDRGGRRISEAKDDPDSLQLNAQGQYSVDATASGLDTS